MKFLILTKKFPYPPVDGESLLVSGFNKALKSRDHDIDILSFNTSKHYYEIENLPADQNPYSEIWLVYLDNSFKPTEAFKNLFSRQPFHITRFINNEFKEKLEEILINKRYDFIILESIYLHPYYETIRKNSAAKIILRAHNVEYEIWDRLTKTSKQVLLKPYLKYLTAKLKKYELANIVSYDFMCTLTKRDMDTFQANGFEGDSFILPAGIEGGYYKPSEIKNEHCLKISFIGSLDWLPNSEGIKWFIEKCWNNPLFSYNSFELNIAGRNTPQWMYKYQKNNIIIHGEVDNSQNFINSCPVMIVPLLAGSGMRLKILEALALGRIVVTTSIGLEGIDATDGKEVLIADTPDEFIEKLIFCHDNFEIIKQISANAVLFFENNYKLENLIDQFLIKLSEN